MLGRSLIDESRETQTSLSLGLRFKDRKDIKSTQIIRFMKAFIDKEEEISLDYKEAFNEDPVKKLEKLGRFIITIDFEITEEDITKVEINKKNINLKPENLRQNNILKRVTFEQQFEKEYQWLLNEGLSAYRKYVLKINLGIIPTPKEY